MDRLDTASDPQRGEGSIACGEDLSFLSPILVLLMILQGVVKRAFNVATGRYCYIRVVECGV